MISRGRSGANKQDGKPLGRIHRDVGTRIVVPRNKIKWNEANPVGHGLIFLSRLDNVFCYLPPWDSKDAVTSQPAAPFQVGFGRSRTLPTSRRCGLVGFLSLLFGGAATCGVANSGPSFSSRVEIFNL